MADEPTIDVLLYDIPAGRWRRAWVQCVDRRPDGSLHCNIAEFAQVVGVPLDAETLEALALAVHRYAEAKYGGAIPREDVVLRGVVGVSRTVH